MMAFISGASGKGSDGHITDHTKEAGKHLAIQLKGFCLAFVGFKGFEALKP